jgi:trehalose 6-phosphate synthase
MNLVAKEFVVAQHAAGGHGALVLSEFAGAADELSEAIVCNPYDPVGTADAIELAIEMDDDARRQRLESMAKRVADHDVELWAERQLRAAERGREVEAPLHVVRAG